MQKPTPPGRNVVQSEDVTVAAATQVPAAQGAALSVRQISKLPQLAAATQVPITMGTVVLVGLKCRQQSEPAAH